MEETPPPHHMTPFGDYHLATARLTDSRPASDTTADVVDSDTALNRFD